MHLFYFVICAVYSIQGVIHLSLPLWGRHHMEVVLPLPLRREGGGLRSGTSSRGGQLANGAFNAVAYPKFRLGRWRQIWDCRVRVYSFIRNGILLISSCCATLTRVMVVPFHFLY